MPRHLLMRKVTTPREIEQLRVFCLKYSKLEKEILSTSYVLLGRDDDEWANMLEIYGDFFFTHQTCGFFLFFEGDDLDNAIGLIECMPKLHNGLLSKDTGFLPAAQGKGYGTQATKLFLEHISPFIGHKTPILTDDNTVEIQTIDGVLSSIEIDNFPSLIVNIKLGFTIAGYQQYIFHDVTHAINLVFPPTLDHHIKRAYIPCPFEIYNPKKDELREQLVALSKKLQIFEYNSAHFAYEWKKLLYPIVETQKIEGAITLLEHGSLQAQFNDLRFSVTPCSDEMIIFGGCEPLEIADGVI